MQIIGKDGQLIELKILGYEFPNEENGVWDGNWLLIYLKVKSNFGNWEVTHPSLTTWDLKRLAQWFYDLSLNNIVEDLNQEFLEPNLAFEVIENRKEDKKMQVRFDLESRSPFADPEKPCFIFFELSNAELAKIAKELNEEYEEFPERKPSFNS